jgi:hypothetical protein
MLISAIVLPATSGLISPLLQPLGVVSRLAEMRGTRARELALNPELRGCLIRGGIREKTSRLPCIEHKENYSLLNIGFDTSTVNSDAKKKLRGLSPRTNYTDIATAAYRRSWCQLLWIEGARWSA